MKISFIVEGKTEKAFIPHLRRYLERYLAGEMPRLDTLPYDGRIPKRDKLRRVVEGFFKEHPPADHVIALTDVYTGTNPPDFVDANDAKAKMRQWVGEEPRFHPHAAQYDFEAWLVPYWSYIQRLAGHNRAAPPGNPENVNHSNPPSYHIKEIFRIGNRSGYYNKPIDANKILKNKDLSIAISQCQELKSLINTILNICGKSNIL